MSAEVVIRPATGSIAMNDEAIDQCDDVAFLLDVLGRRWLPSLRRWLAEPEWAAKDDESRRIAQDHIAKMGRILARLTELVDDPPDDAREPALNARALREADAVLIEVRAIRERRERRRSYLPTPPRTGSDDR